MALTVCTQGKRTEVATELRSGFRGLWPTWVVGVRGVLIDLKTLQVTDDWEAKAKTLRWVHLVSRESLCVFRTVEAWQAHVVTHL